MPEFQFLSTISDFKLEHLYTKLYIYEEVQALKANWKRTDAPCVVFKRSFVILGRCTVDIFDLRLSNIEFRKALDRHGSELLFV